QRPDGASQHAATQPGISISASQSSASGTQHADMNISADTNIDAGASASQPDLTSTGASRSSGKSTTSVSINGQTIPVPDGGMVNRVMSDGSNTTTVQVSSNASDSTNSSVDVQVQSTSSSGGGQYWASVFYWSFGQDAYSVLFGRVISPSNINLKTSSNKKGVRDGKK